MTGELLRLAIVLVCLTAWVAGFTGLLVWADNTTRKGGENGNGNA